MSNVDTTSFARILLGAMGQGADIFNRASSGAQSIIDSRDNRAFRDRAFAAQESQRAFGNDLALKDQAIQQAAADRSAQQFPLAQRMMQVQSEIQAANLQEMEQQQRTRSTMQQFLAPRVAERIRATSARKYGAPAFKDEMFAYAVANGDVEPQSLTWMMQQLDGERDLDDLREAAKKHRSLLEGTRRSSAASPEAKAQSDALLIMLESENPKVLEKAVMQAAEAQQQQAMQAQRSQLAGVVAGGGQLTPEQSLIVMDDPALRRMQEQANRPQITPEQQAAEDEAAAQNIHVLRGVPLPQARAFVALRRQDMAGLDSMPTRQQNTSAADEKRRLDEMWQQATRLNQAAEAIQETNPTRAAEMKAQSRQLQQQVIASQGQSQQTEPVLLSKVDEQRTLESMKQKIKAFRAQNGRAPTEDELIALETQQVGTPQVPR
jgi:hypothetical protein